MKPPNKYKQLKEKHKPKLSRLEKYLQKQDYEENTRRQYLNYTACFLEWLKQNETQVSYSDLLSFINHSKSQGDSTRLVNRKLSSIRKYYEYLQHNGIATKNPASGLFLKGKKAGIPNNLLDKEELQQLYENYQVYDLRTARNRVILNLIINQGLTTGEIRALEPIHLKLKSGTIGIQGSRHSNGRTLKLEANQIIELQEYLNETRPEILQTIKGNTYRSGRKVKQPDFKTLERQLFISLNGAVNIKNSLLHFVAALKRINGNVRDLRQLRQSVITEWLKTEDVRKVQHKAGHRYVSTTERYQVSNLEDLQEALNIHHPLK
jgi:integrase/recombinase XerD